MSITKINTFNYFEIITKRRRISNLSRPLKSVISGNIFGSYDREVRENACSFSKFSLLLKKKRILKINVIFFIVSSM